ncbi:MAG: hypothetical protein HY042_04975 [Spirochaetia bacterium]|nr:hypothetical protein [Spirochaetia bacterium]
MLHGIHYTGFFMGAVYRLRSIFPDHLYGTGNGSYMVLTASLGGMSGNLFFGWLLFAQGIHVYEALGPSNYLPLFVSAAVIHVAIALGFVLLPGKRAAALKAVHAQESG